MKNKAIIGIVAIVLLLLIFGVKILLTLIGFGAGVVVGVMKSKQIKGAVDGTSTDTM